jgi:hypothetical protein
MPISAIIEKDLVNSVQNGSIQGTNGVWINADVKVFIPLDVLEKCNDQAVTFSISQEEAVALFDEVFRLKRLKPFIFNDWETGFIDSLDLKMKEEERFRFSQKQSAKIKKLHEDFAVELSNLEKEPEKVSTDIENEDIPF